MTLPVTEASSDRDTSECRRAGGLSICPRQTIRDPRTDVAEPRPFHVPLIDTLGPVRRGDATVMSPSLPVSRTVTLSTPGSRCVPINQTLDARHCRKLSNRAPAVSTCVEVSRRRAKRRAIIVLHEFAFCHVVYYRISTYSESYSTSLMLEKIIFISIFNK